MKGGHGCCPECHRTIRRISVGLTVALGAALAHWGTLLGQVINV
ncbi:hypothetical protein [Actinokineospora iranica]|uniref:Uncharacterized protein n=1 Tax=Actinokineospora iranica TaxID=1271860 RepID=A0A1G6K5H3_9PSEU|nr:hypothetical protein [Actinokineospora iranica]SDC25855.1 hypothetical protein SAMN05216174_101710 [Actinokineospora iranica]